MKRPTLEDVARSAGVSRATVSRVVRSDPGTAPETASRVREAIEHLGYVPNGAARSLATGQTNTVAVVVPEPDQRIFSDPFFSRAVAGISSGLTGSGVQLVMVFAENRGHPDMAVDFLLEGRIAGVIIVSHHRSDGIAEAAIRLPVPTVFIGAPLLDDPQRRVNFVDNDNVHGGRLAGERMLERGVRHPAIIAGPQDMAAAVDRLEGWRTPLVAAGLDITVAQGDYTQASGEGAVGELLERNPDIDGIFAASELMALGAVAELERRGKRVGQDISLISFDDFDGATRCDPPLTSVVNPAIEVGRSASAMVLALMRDDAVESPVILPVNLRVRESG